MLCSVSTYSCLHHALPCPALSCLVLSLLQRLKVASPINQANAAAVVSVNGSGNTIISPREGGAEENKEVEPSVATPTANRVVSDIDPVQSAEAVTTVSEEDAGIVEGEEEERACVEGTATGEHRDKAMDLREKEPLLLVDEGEYFDDDDGFPPNGPGRRSGGKRRFRGGTG